jgi:putative membrane protein
MILLICALGILCGIICGLIPGLHSNNIAILFLASPIFGTDSIAFMLCLCTTQAFVEFIPSTYLGSPSPDTFESTLPAQRLMLEGKALEAITYAVFGGIIAVIAGVILTPIFFLFIEKNSEQIIQITPIVLFFALILFIVREKGSKLKLLALFVIIASTTQSLLFKDQIFPLICGYFGTAGLIYSLKEKQTRIKQTNEFEIDLHKTIDSLKGLCGGAIVSIMPGIGSNTAAGIINVFSKTKDEKSYLAMLGAISLSNFFFSYSTLIALQKARNGAMIALKDKIFYTQETLLIGTIIMLIAAGIGAISTIFIAKKFNKLIDETKIRTISITSILFMTVLVAYFNGIVGLITLLFSTSLGLFVLSNKLNRSTCMSALIVPTIFFYLFILL